jgi:hypothetical protein
MPQAPMAQGLLELLSLQQALMAQWLPQAPMAQGLLAREPERAPPERAPQGQRRQGRPEPPEPMARQPNCRLFRPRPSRRV